MLKIIDISSHTNVYSIEGLKQFDGVMIKATEGATYTSTTLDRDVKDCINANVPFGFYHFAGHHHTAIEEYNFFKSVVSKYNSQLRDCLDYEDGIRDYKFITDFMSIDSALIFYTYRDIAKFAGVAKNKTWIAIPGHNTKALDGYLGIQYKLDTNVNLISNCDVSIFNESLFKTQPVTKKTILRSVNMKPMLYGEKSNRVKLLQILLNKVLGLTLETTSGIYGSNTQNAVIKYQQIMGLTCDGDAGALTISKLFK